MEPSNATFPFKPGDGHLDGTITTTWDFKGSLLEAGIWVTQQTQTSFQSKHCLEEEEDEMKENPGAGICRPEGQVADPRLLSKVNKSIIVESPLTDDNISHVNLQPQPGEDACDFKGDLGPSYPGVGRGGPTEDLGTSRVGPHRSHPPGSLSSRFIGQGIVTKSPKEEEGFMATA